MIDGAAAGNPVVCVVPSAIVPSRLEFSTRSQPKQHGGARWIVATLPPTAQNRIRVVTRPRAPHQLGEQLGVVLSRIFYDNGGRRAGFVLERERQP
jgi:hypothetical protein